VLDLGPQVDDDGGMLRRVCIAALVMVALAGCRLKEEAPASIPAPPDVAAPPADAIKTPSGLASKVLQIGFSNVRPSVRSTVRVNYTGWTPDGKMFDSSVVRGEPAEFPLTQVIAGWTEGVQLMVVGEKRRFWIPGALAYDNIPDTPGIPPNPKGMLVFDIELLAVK
jgi:peptidylprolyl isomerase